MLQNFFVNIYDFFQRRKALFMAVFLLSFGLWVFLATRVKLQQDISTMLPDSKAIKAMNEVMSNTQAGEQVIFLMSLKDTTQSDPDSVITAVNIFNEQLSKVCGQWIDSITLQASGGYEESLAEIFNQYLPLFLTEQDYRRIDTLIRPERIQQTLTNNKTILLSPAGMVYKQIVAKDPVGISGFVWSKLKALQFDPSYEPYDGYLFSNNQKRLTFFLKPEYPASETGKNSEFFTKLDELIEGFEQANPGVHVTYFGGPAVAAGNATQMKTDTIVTLSVTIVLLLALTFYFFRRKRTPLLLLVPVVYGAAMGLAIVYLVQGAISVMALGAGAIILGIAIDFSIHFLSHLRHVKDVRETIRELVQPLTIGSFTTIAAFLSLRFVNTPIVQDLGLFAAGSLIGAALCTLLFLPHLPLGGDRKETKHTIFDKIAKWKPERNKWLVLLILLLTPVMLYFSFNVQFDSDLMHLNYLSPKLQKAQKEVSDANAVALSSVFVVANGTDEQTALQKLEVAHPVIVKLQEKGWVRSVLAPSSLLPSVQEQKARIVRWQQYWTEEKVNTLLLNVNTLAAQAGYNTAAFASFQSSLRTSPQVLDEHSTRVLKSLFPNGFSKDKTKAIAALKVPQEHRQDVFTALSHQKDIIVTDRQQGATQLVDILNDDFNQIALMSAFIVFFALLIGYGRIELAVMSFLPMVISWVWILGLMSLLGLKFNIVNIIISSLIFGLGDDYSIFTMDGLVERYRTGKNKLESVRAAVYVSVVTVIIGLGVLLLAKHPALRSIAFTSVTGLLCVLFISQTLQPFLFNWFIQNRADKGFQPFTLRSFCISVFAFTYFFTGSMVLTILGVFFTKLWPFNKEKGKYYFHAWVSRYTWSMMYIMGNLTKRVHNLGNEDFREPAVYIANHSSFLDILVTTMLNPRLVLLTNRWVWRSPVFGAVVRMAEYYPVADGAEDSIEPLRDLTNRGYSVVVFPEGTRSYDDTIKRFHKGAFYIAEELKLDVVPLVLHGINYSMQKGDWLLKDGYPSVYIYPRIKYGDTTYGTTLKDKAKNIGKWFRNEFCEIKAKNETPTYFREQLIRSYTYKGPSLEWYCRIKTKLEGYYEQFHEMIPRKGRFYDLGCGYGFMTYMLHWASRDRVFTGVDYDEEKIETAQGNFLRDEHINFEYADVTRYPLDTCDGIIISDVLHYLLPDQQQELLDKCLSALNNGGLLIIRDGVSELKERHRGTERTEIWSTKLLKFNKIQNELHFISKAFIEEFARKNNLELQVIDKTKFTSNLIFILKKKVYL
jgi:1-acyl-sn-glycerol-3-phosphate acyltransferase